MSDWEPVIDPYSTLGARAAAVLQKITEEAIEAGGLDSVLLLAYRGAAEQNREWLNRAVDHLNAAISGADALYSLKRFQLFGGLAGLGWTLAFVMRQLGRTQGVARLNEDVDAALLQELQRGRWNGPYGLATGLAGIGVYFRHGLPDGKAKLGFELVRAHLEDAAKRSPDFGGAGVAEGAGGVVGLIDQAVVDGRTNGARPCSWWNGELAVAAVMLGKSAEKPAWTQDAVERCLAWAPEQENDASLLRGAAGAAHLWSRIYGCTGDARCKDASGRWWERAITLLETETPAVGAARVPFLAGAAGVGLALSAALIPAQPIWDAALGFMQLRWNGPDS